MKNQFTTFFALFFLLLYPFFKFIWFQRYPFLSLEALTMTAAFLVLAILVGLISKKPAWLALWFGLAFYIIITTGPTYVSPKNLIIRGVIAILIIASLTLSNKNLVKIVTVGLIGIFATDIVMGLPRMPTFDSFIQTPTQTANNKTELEHTLIVVLDEHVGVDALPETITETKNLKEKLKTFYVTEGFDLYTSAFSNYYYTEDAISNTLNNTYLNQRAGHFPDYNKSEYAYHLRKNALFNLFSKKNYTIRAYQTPFLDVCHGENQVESCFEYPHNWLRAIWDPAFSFSERLRVVFSQFVITNSFVRELNGGTIDHDWLKTRTGPLQTFPVVLNRIQTDILSATHNTLFFAHLLMPHYPYVYDANCKPRPVADWKNRREFGLKTEQEIREAAENRYRLYAEQTECLNKQLTNFFNTLKNAGLYDSTQIIFYGDHGTKILQAHLPTETEAPTMTPADMHDSYATLFATKPRGQTQGRIVDDERNTVDLIWTVMGEKNETTTKSQPTVFVRDTYDKKRLVAFPLPKLHR